MSEEQQLDNSDFGRAGIEKSQGYENMQMAVPDPDPEPAIDADSTLAKHFNRPREPEPVVREYNDVQTGERRPDNETVPLKRVAADIASAREQERAAREEQSNRDLAEALDYLQQQVPPEPPPSDINDAARAQAAQQQPDPNLELQPERLDQTQAEAVVAEADKKIAEFLADPYVRDKLERDVIAPANAQVEQAKAAYQQVIAQNANAALAVLTAQFPEFAGLSGPQLEGALKVSNPQRAEAFRHLVGQVNTVVAAHQQQAAQQQAQQYERAVDTFRQFAAEQDARVLTNDPPETVAAIRNGIIAEAKAAGISEKELITVYNTNSAMRHSFVQNLIADGMRYRLAQRSVPQHRATPVPSVARPGTSEGRSDDNSAYASLERQFRGQSLSPKQAAELVIARRSARS